jgi:hypothetical protein
MPFMGALPQVPTTETAKPKESEERERARARGARFAGTFALDDE